MLASRAMCEARIFYIANCIRFQEMRSISQREFWQAGAELIGGTDAEGDAEAIALALTALEAVGIKDAYVDIGNAGLFRELANGLGVSDLVGLRRAMESRSLAGLKGAVREGKPFNVFSSLIKKRGGIEVIEDATKGMDGAGRYLDYFKELFSRLEAYNLRNRVNIDLTTLREMEYYNGTVFDIYVGGVGVPIGGGGRYDTMMEEFGMGGAKATGFAVSVDLCVRALDSRGFDYGGNLQPLQILFEKGCADKAIGIAKELRRKGIACAINAYKGEREGILVGNEARDLATGEIFRTGERARQ
jgi:ATP phosphoribosyltransferase regulatory subunit HisZ